MIECYFRIEKEAEMAHNESGEMSEAYTKMSMDGSKELSDEEYKRVQEGFRQYISDVLKKDIKYINPVTKEEYENECEECEE